MKIYEQKRGKLKEEDLLELGKLLMKAGYIVHVGREKRGTSSQYTQYVQYWEQEGSIKND